MSGIDALGYVGSGCIVLSVMMTSMRRLRLIGLVGALSFVAYGVFLGAWPVVATNLGTACIQLYRLRSLRTGLSASDADAPVSHMPTGVDPAWPPPEFPQPRPSTGFEATAELPVGFERQAA